MAAIFRDSFDHYRGDLSNDGLDCQIFAKWDNITVGFGSDNVYTSPSSTWNGRSVPARTGLQCLGFFADANFGPHSAYVSKVLGTVLTTHVFIGMAVYLPTIPFQGAPTSNSILKVRWGVHPGLSLAPNTSGGFDVYSYDGSDLKLYQGSTFNGVYQAGEWFYLELDAEFLPGGGMNLILTKVNVNSLEVYNVNIDNSASIVISGVDILDVGCTDIAGSTNPLTEVFVDDLYINDFTNDALCISLGISTPAWEKALMGDVRISAWFPDADGFHQGWEPLLLPDHYPNVNEQYYDGDTSFVSTSVPSTMDTYRYPSLVLPTGGTLLDVQAVAVAKKLDAGGRNLTHIARQGSAERYSPSGIPITETYLAKRYIWSVDPNDSLPWTTASFSASEFGPRLDS